MVPESVWPIIVRESTQALSRSMIVMRQLGERGVIPRYDDTAASAHELCCTSLATSRPSYEGTSDAEIRQCQFTATRPFDPGKIGRTDRVADIKTLYASYNASLIALSDTAIECRDLDARGLGQKYEQWMQDASQQCGILATRLEASDIPSTACTSSVAASVRQFATESLTLTNRASALTKAGLKASCSVYAQRAHELDLLVSDCETAQVTSGGAAAGMASLAHASELIRDVSIMTQVSAWHNWGQGQQ